MVLAVTYPWASASSFFTTAGDATPLWEDVTDPTCSGDTRPWASASSYLSSQSVADSRQGAQGWGSRVFVLTNTTRDSDSL